MNKQRRRKTRLQAGTLKPLLRWRDIPHTAQMLDGMCTACLGFVDDPRHTGRAVASVPFRVRSSIFVLSGPSVGSLATRSKGSKMTSSVLPVPDRPSLNGTWDGRRYIGPKAQAAVHEEFFNRVVVEATDRVVPTTDVWREVIYAGLLRTGRATQAEIREACALVGINFTALDGAA